MPEPLTTSPGGTELVIGLVGAVGTDLPALVTTLGDQLDLVGYTSEVIRLSELLDDLDRYRGKLNQGSLFEQYSAKMDAGTELREVTGRGDSLAMLAVAAIRGRRKKQGSDPTRSQPRHAIILHSLKHPDEVQSLRRIYGSNFVLISAYMPEEDRFRKLASKLSASEFAFQAKEFFVQAQKLFHRDESEAGKPLGQQVRKTFPMADVFIDVTDPSRLRHEVERFIGLLFGHPYYTPTRAEYGMSHAQAAANRSSAMGRQVGAAITTSDGDVSVAGTNEVPKAGGGLYWPGDEGDGRDFVTGVDINDKLKQRLLADVLQRLRSANILRDDLSETPINDLVVRIMGDPDANVNKSQIMSIIEYGRCVHAEMTAITDAARRGIAVGGCTLYTTTFPCHECARHIVAAGIVKVIYIDPYPKSLVMDLHHDSILLDKPADGQNRVVFKPFVGVSPQMYLRLFQADRRKGSDGNAVRWRPQTAELRFRESSVAVKVNELAEVEKFRQIMEANGLWKPTQTSQNEVPSDIGAESPSGISFAK